MFYSRVDGVHVKGLSGLERRQPRAPGRYCETDSSRMTVMAPNVQDSMYKLGDGAGRRRIGLNGRAFGSDAGASVANCIAAI
jgi:hypothetical protein